MALRLVLVLLAFAVVDIAQNRIGRISGSLITHAGQPVGQAQVEAREQRGLASVRYATSGADGSYLLNDLPPGIYNLKITAAGFRSAEIHDVELDAATVRRLPAVPLEIGLIADCGTDRGPDYYRPSRGAVKLAAVGGVGVSDKAMPVQGATVTLYVKGKGRIARQTTTGGGTFRFAGLQMQSAEYWVSIEKEGFFSEEVRHLFLPPGYEAMYSPISMGSCRPGHCQANLKTIRVLPSCA